MVLNKQNDLIKNLSLEKEISTLKKLGLEDYEIEYLLFLKQKEQAREKWAKSLNQFHDSELSLPAMQNM